MGVVVNLADEKGHGPSLDGLTRLTEEDLSAVNQLFVKSMDSPVASGARGLARGQFFTENGDLVASTTQEGLMRVVDPQRKKPRSDPRLQT